jgi:hypothetical protein
MPRLVASWNLCACSDEDNVMTHYRAYFLGPDGHFVKAEDIVCDDDEAARKQAQRMADGFDVELWQQDRRIEKFEGVPSGSCVKKALPHPALPAV